MLYIPSCYSFLVFIICLRSSSPLHITLLQILFSYPLLLLLHLLYFLLSYIFFTSFFGFHLFHILFILCCHRFLFYPLAFLLLLLCFSNFLYFLATILWPSPFFLTFYLRGFRSSVSFIFFVYFLLCCLESPSFI